MSAGQFEPLALDSPEAQALRAWLLENDTRCAQGVSPAALISYLDDAERGQGQVEVPARFNAYGVPITYTVARAG